MSTASLLYIIGEIRRRQQDIGYNEAIENIKKANNRKEKLSIVAELYNKYPLEPHSNQVTLWRSVYKRN
jgi:hypothetical protein